MTSGSDTPKQQPHGAEHLSKHKWPPGKSGNPGGRPKGTSMTAELRRALDAQGGKGRREVIKALIKHAKKGNAHLMQQIFDRLDGRVADRIVIEIELGRMLDVLHSVCEEHGQQIVFEQTVERLAAGGYAATAALSGTADE